MTHMKQRTYIMVSSVVGKADPKPMTYARSRQILAIAIKPIMMTGTVSPSSL